MKIIIALLIFGIIVFIHELGHFLLAKANGVYVEEFSIGMGPRLFSFTKNETKYSLKLLPLGGSCMMLGEDEDSQDERAFGNKSVWARISVVFAGPFFNFILAFVLAIVLIALVGADTPKVLKVDENSSAAVAGIKKGDEIVSYHGTKIGVGREIYIADYFEPLSDQDVNITYKRDGKKYDVVVKPEKKVQYLMGMSYSGNSSDTEVTISEGGALEKAGLVTGDQIVSINGEEVSSGKQMQKVLKEHPLDGSNVTLTYRHNGKEKTVDVTPSKTEYYTLGLTCNTNYSNTKMGIGGVLKYSLLEIRYQIKTVVLSLKYLVTGHISADSVAGPVGIVNIVGDTYSESIEYGWLPMLESMISICIMLSANLGVMNLLPIPALDGGRLLFMFIELIRGKKIPPEKEGFVHFLGFVLLMILMVLIMFNDIRNIFIK